MKTASICNFAKPLECLTSHDMNLPSLEAEQSRTVSGLV